MQLVSCAPAPRGEPSIVTAVHAASRIVQVLFNDNVTLCMIAFTLQLHVCISSLNVHIIILQDGMMAMTTLCEDVQMVPTVLFVYSPEQDKRIPYYKPLKRSLSLER